MEKKTEYLHIRITTKDKIFIENAALRNGFTTITHYILWLVKAVERNTGNAQLK